MSDITNNIYKSAAKNQSNRRDYSKSDIELVRKLFFKDKINYVDGELDTETIEVLLSIANMYNAVTYLNQQKKFQDFSDNLTKSLDFLKYCDSILEKIFFLALVGDLTESFFIDCIKINHRDNTLILKDEPSIDFVNGEQVENPKKPTVEVNLQENIDNYRVDFLINFLTGAEQNIVVKSGPYEYVKKVDNYIKKFIVEIDGHDFHEKTKQQAQKDKERDRLFTSRGYQIYRFTGSEIYKNPYRCTSDIISDALLNTWVDEAIPPQS